MVKIDKNDIENIKLISKETKIKNINSIRIKKGNYEIEIASNSIKNITDDNQINISQKKQTNNDVIEEIVNEENELISLVKFTAMHKDIKE